MQYGILDVGFSAVLLSAVHPTSAKALRGASCPCVSGWTYHRRGALRIAGDLIPV